MSALLTKMILRLLVQEQQSSAAGRFGEKGEDKANSVLDTLTRKSGPRSSLRHWRKSRNFKYREQITQKLQIKKAFSKEELKDSSSRFFTMSRFCILNIPFLPCFFLHCFFLFKDEEL
jgi:hypothetical protein